jgi:putative autotransporter adhesin-like protein
MRTHHAILLASLLLPAAVILAAATATAGEPTSSGSATIKGSGKPATTQRTVPAFRAIALTGPIDLDFRLGPTQSIELSADDNVLPLITTTVRESSLTIALNAKSISPRTPLRATITAPTITALALRGTGNAVLSGLKSSSFALSLEGSGSVKATGAVSTLSISLTGSGNIEAKLLHSSTASIDLEGSGNATLHATGTVAVNLNGSGNITIHGRPKSVAQSVHGTGRLSIPE